MGAKAIMPPTTTARAAVDEAPPAAVWIPVMTERIAREFRPLQILLFGSHARGEAHRDSDVDLLVVMPDETRGVRQRETAVAILNALRDLPVFKDIVVTTPGEIAERREVVGTVLRLALQEGKLLYEQA
jgi:predicted nucleotidyltransferase